MSQDPTVVSEQDRQDIRAGVAMKIDVQTQGGAKVVQLIEALLAQRIEAMVKDDPYSRGLMNILENVGMNIALAAHKSAQLMAKHATGE